MADKYKKKIKPLKKQLRDLLASDVPDSSKIAIIMKIVESSRDDGKVLLFNRLWDASAAKASQPADIFKLLMEELMQVRRELTIPEEGRLLN